MAPTYMYVLPRKAVTLMAVLIVCHSSVALYAQGQLTLHETPVSWNKAVDACYNDGGSLLDLDLIENNELDKAKSAVLPEQFTWIKDRIYISYFMAYYGSMGLGNWSGLQTSKDVIPDNDIFRCSEYCGRKQLWMYIGLSADTCLCFLDPPKVITYNSSDTFLPSLSGQTGDHNTAILFRKSPLGMRDSAILLTQAPLTRFECACVTIDGVHVAFTGSKNCNTGLADGYICEGINIKNCVLASPVNLRYFFHRLLHGCLFMQKITLPEAHKACHQMNGRLAAFRSRLKSNVKSDLERHFQFWVRNFRVIQISKDIQSKLTNLCLSAKLRPKTEMVVTNCSHPRNFACWYNSSDFRETRNKLEHYSAGVTGTVEDNTSTTADVGNSTASIHSNSGNQDFVFNIPLIIQVSAAWILVLAVVVWATVCVTSKRRQRSADHLNVAGPMPCEFDLCKSTNNVYDVASNGYCYIEAASVNRCASSHDSTGGYITAVEDESRL